MANKRLAVALAYSKAIVESRDFVNYRGQSWWDRWKELTGKQVPDSLAMNRSLRARGTKRQDKRVKNLKPNVARPKSGQPRKPR